MCDERTVKPAIFTSSAQSALCVDSSPVCNVYSLLPSRGAVIVTCETQFAQGAPAATMRKCGPAASAIAAALGHVAGAWYVTAHWLSEGAEVACASAVRGVSKPTAKPTNLDARRVDGFRTPGGWVCKTWLCTVRRGRR